MHARSILLVALLVAFAASLPGCDISARWDLHRAEKLMRQCDDVNAEFWANREYRKAQKLFEEAMDLARARKINEARDKAAECRDWAEEAVMWSKLRSAEMEEEKDRVHSKKI